jgi:hypothetical protein
MSANAILIVILVIVAIVAIVFLILWLTKNSGNNSTLSITGVKFMVTNSTTLVATWDRTGNANDMVTLYANTSQISFDSSGRPSSNSSKVLVGGPVPSSAKTVSITNLAPNTTYFVTLVVSNGNSFSNSSTGTIYTGSIPSTNFMISELHTAGAITTGTNGTVVYSTTPNKSTADLWKYDTTNSTLSATSLISGVTGTRVLYNNNGTLAVSTNGTNVTPENSQWTYDTFGQGRWCLKATPNVCMNLATPISGTAPITLQNGSTTQWKNISVNTSTF